MTAPVGDRLSSDAPVDIVIPTIGRESLTALLRSLAAQAQPGPADRIYIVDDRMRADASIDGLVPPSMSLRVLRSYGRGPAAARNLGWRAGRLPWVAFLDDDVVVSPDWRRQLAGDLGRAAARTAASQARIDVPLPHHRRPTDFERGTAGLATARWITADMAYRRSALMDVGGFDERFPRAFREDADLALRVCAAGWKLETGDRLTTHPVRAARWNASARQQRGNADDALMTLLHGADWRRRAEAPRGRLPQHAVTAASAAAAAGLAVAGHRRAAAVAVGLWAANAAEFCWRRIAPGPRNRAEVEAMLATSLAIPFIASYYAVRGRVAGRRLLRESGRARPGAVLVDRDNTIVRDVPYNGDPAAVVPMPGAKRALRRLRDAGIPVAVISNQSGVARGLITAEQVDAVNREVERILGPFAGWFVCLHGEGDGCACRKPSPGLIEQAANQLGVPASTCVVIGDIGSDVAAAQAAGAAAILVPTGATLEAEIARSPVAARTLEAAVELILSGRVAP